MVKIEVELDIFSGRPNPMWGLSDAQIEELKVKLDTPYPTTKPKQMPPIFGYRGFLLTNLSKVQTIPEQLHLFDGVLTITDKEITNYYKDVSNIEEWLINQASERGYGKIIDEDRQHLHIYSREAKTQEFWTG